MKHFHSAMSFMYLAVGGFTIGFGLECDIKITILGAMLTAFGLWMDEKSKQ